MDSDSDTRIHKNPLSIGGCILECLLSILMYEVYTEALDFNRVKELFAAHSLYVSFLL